MSLSRAAGGGRSTPSLGAVVVSENGAAVLTFAVLAGLPLVASDYAVFILPQYMLYGVLAMSLGLFWGFAGILSFGQAAFFALGAYTMGLAMHGGGVAGVIDGAYLGLFLAALGAGALAAAVGYFLFSAGIRDTYFVIITIALSIIAEQLAITQSQITGGGNGMFIDRMMLNLGPLGSFSLEGDAAMYYFVLPIAGLVYLALRRLVGTKFGKVLVGIRENEDRVISLGLDASLYKTAAFALSGALAGFAGALYATHASFIAPSLGGVLFSTEVVVWVAIGGRTSLLGALLGGIVVASLSNYLSAITPEYWQLVLGLLFVAVIVYFKGGVAGALAAMLKARRGRAGEHG